MFQPHTYFQRAYSICLDFCGAWQPKWQPRPTSDCRVDVYRVPQMRHSPQELLYIKITWDELVRCGAWILTAFGRVDATWTVLIFSHFLPLSTRFDQICSLQLPPYPAISCVSIAYPASDRPPSPLQVRLDIEAGTAERLSEVSLCNFCATGLSRDVWGPLEEWQKKY